MTNQKQNFSKHNPPPKVKYTPGPWVISSRDFGPNGMAYDIDSESGAIVASDLALGDARLIAAAPELLEACNALHDALSAILEDTDNTILGASLRKQANKAVNISFRAIAKAEVGAE